MPRDSVVQMYEDNRLESGTELRLLAGGAFYAVKYDGDDECDPGNVWVYPPHLGSDKSKEVPITALFWPLPVVNNPLAGDVPWDQIDGDHPLRVWDVMQSMESILRQVANHLDDECYLPKQELDQLRLLVETAWPLKVDRVKKLTQKEEKIIRTLLEHRSQQHVDDAATKKEVLALLDKFT